MWLSCSVMRDKEEFERIATVQSKVEMNDFMYMKNFQ